MDRNRSIRLLLALPIWSLSARRAWIEIAPVVSACDFSSVALRKESVDRNDTVQIVVVIVHAVALRKESVDRNFFSRLDAEY